MLKNAKIDGLLVRLDTPRDSMLSFDGYPAYEV